jgi:hypothetical protein
MSDVGDFTGVSAGATVLLTSGSAVPAGGPPQTFAIPLANVPQTTRSLLLLMNQDVSNAGASQITQVKITGTTSRLAWVNSVTILADNGGVSALSGEAWLPIYAPFYGQVDTTGSIVVTLTGSIKVNYWVLALPDADLLGSAGVPLVVGNSPYSLLGAQGGVSPLTVSQSQANWVPVHLWDNTGTILGVQANPLAVSQGRTGTTVAGRQFTTTTFQQLVGPPAAGQVRVIESVISTATGTLSFGPNANTAQLAMPTTTGVWNPGWLLNAGGQGLWVGTSITGGAVYVSWHDESE